MKILDKFFPHESLKVMNETPYFKESHIRYYTKHMANGSLECWAYPVAHSYGSDLAVEREEPIYLGKIIKNEIIKPVNFYELPMSLQRGALRLFREVGVYQE